ncbi:reverse transcriptase domain-containing protein [Tanacetum coccineum]
MTPPPGFSTPPQIPNNTTSERPLVITTVFAATTPENTPFAYRASTSANPNPMISPAFVEANYEVLGSLLRERRRQIRYEGLRTKLEYFSEDYDEEREMEPRPEPNREATPTLRPREGSRGGRNAEGIRISEIEAREDENRGVNLPPLLAAHLGRNKSGESTRAFVTRYIDDTLHILVLHEEQRISGFVHGLRTRILVEHLSTDLPSTYKGLMEKTYTLIEAREVATNETPNDRRENFKRSRKSSWDNNRGQKGRDRFSPYRGPNHRLLSNLSKSLREILATEKAVRSFKQPPRMRGSRRSRDMSKYCHFHEDHGHDTNDCRQLRNQIEEADELYAKNKVEGLTSEGKEITFPSGGSNSSALIVIKAKIFGREVNRVHMDGGSSCKVIYEHCFMKLKPSIRASKVDSKVPLIGISGEKSWSIRKILLEITIGDPPLTRKETLNFVIIKSDSPYNMLLGRIEMQKMGIMVSTIHGAIKLHTTEGISTIFLSYESNKVKKE